MKKVYEKGETIIMKKTAANKFNVLEKVKLLEDTDKGSDFLIVEAFRPETNEFIELIIENDSLLKEYR